MRRAEYDWPLAQREAWCDWMRKHGLNPNDVALPGWVEADDASRTVRAVCYERDASGRIRIEGDEAVRSVVEVQLESRPMPLPVKS